jgi:adenosine/AMP kinase
MLELEAIPLDIPVEGNITLRQTHFIKSVEDIYEAVVAA